MRQLFARVTLGLTLLYVAFLASYVFLRGFSQENGGWIYLLNVFALFLFLPTVPLFIIGFIMRSRVTMIVCAIPVALFLSLYGELFLPRYLGVIPPQDTFTVLTHNLQSDSSDPQSAIQMIEASGADIVLLQELSQNAAKTISAQLENAYPYQSLLPGGSSGMGVISRFSIRTADSFTAGHAAQHLVIDVRGRDVDLFNVHPNHSKVSIPGVGRIMPLAGRGVSATSQLKELSIINEQVAKVQGPIILAGDLNTTDQTRQYQQIKDNLIDAFRESGYGFGFTFPVPGHYVHLPFALLRIDYVFHSSELKAFSVRTENRTGSDHLPVLVTLGFNSTDH
jgi:vancomycin resistance protein VanJ